MSFKRIYLFITLVLVLSLPLRSGREASADSSPHFSLFIGMPRPVVVHHVERPAPPRVIVLEHHLGHPVYHHDAPPWVTSWDKHRKKLWKKHWKDERRHWHHHE